MATRARQPQLRRRLSAGVLVALISAALVGAAGAYEPPRGDQFFLLSDASVGSDGVAVVRLEAPAGAPYGHVERYGGADIVVYRVPDPIAFLKRQPNLHRVEVKGTYTGEGLANTVSHLWGAWNRQARRSWQRLFAAGTRKAVTTAAPETKAPPGNWTVEYESQPQWAPIAGLPVVDRFRYPVWQAKPMEPPAQVKLAGSSSEWDWARSSRGNVLVPIGKRGPGLYLVEAVIGSYRAITLVFVSDTVALTKVSAGELLVWTVNRKTGQAVGGVDVAWTDGVGTLQSGTTGADGVAVLRHASPEKTYVIGRDGDGGVFVSENFYYDSEIYDTKLYAVTDRPLYRPGDTVHVKVLGREFKDARHSTPVVAGPLTLTVLDPTGTPVVTRALTLSPASGAATAVELPVNSASGGYDIRLEYRGGVYGAAFRVADYVKPHFEIDVRLDGAEPKTREPIKGRVVLRYPDGGPVRGASVQMVVKSQALTMVETELRYADRSPVKLEADELTTGEDGTAAFTLPAAEQPSRYVLTLLASDAAAYRVRTTREILIERGAALYTLAAPRRFSAPGETVPFTISPARGGPEAPVRWERMRLENRARDEGLVRPGAPLALTFAEPGSYTVSLRDPAGRLVGATSHWVAGPGLAAAPGTIEIVFDRERYKAGEVARALLTFSEPVDEALLTLERDRVERHARLTAPAPWLRVSRLGPTQWWVEIPVRAEHAPNMTFSVLYARGGDYVFQNRGLRVEQDSVGLAFNIERETYKPGEHVRVEVASTVAGKPVPARLTVSVVDEMIYILQPEIAPDILEFFYHPRRNNVRTSSSLAFISYDMALSALPSPPPRSGANSRAVKVLERPRRDVADTALWIPELLTDANGRATFSFKMPDALGRWRITARAVTDAGIVGQRAAWVASDMPVYLKWAGPTRFRAGDQPIADVVVFNRTPAETAADLVISGGGLAVTRPMRLAPGPNHVALPLPRVADGAVTLSLHQGGAVADTLATTLAVSPTGWTAPRALTLPVTAQRVPLALPADARNVTVAFTAPGVGAFNRIVDDLVDYPYGCVEQTASRLIPLSLAFPRFAGAPAAIRDGLAMRLSTNRLRLVHMAGPDAVFAWWGRATTDSALMTAYAYYADWHAARVLGVTLPSEHWTRLLEVYRTRASGEPLLLRALAVWFMGEMGLPTKTLVDGLQDEVVGGD
ncbi:MAG TPA: MG2 domain-containing protein, partial [Methylomirabilota bacterium]|nr:MG2 domain-containing protein [Methylomirabilota bacterium]